MPRRPNLEIGLRCKNCKEFTQSINLIIIKKETNNRFYIKAVCLICNKFKTKYLNIEQINLLPDEIRNAPDNTTFTDTIERNGGIILLLPLIGAIAAGITALASAGGATASSVISAKNSVEQERHNRELEAAARGNGLKSVDSIKNDKDVQPLKRMSDRALPVERSMTDDELINKSIEFLTGKGFSVTI